MGGRDNNLRVLGEYQRGYRMLTTFSATGRPDDLAPRVSLRTRLQLANDLAFFAECLGRLEEAWAIWVALDGWMRSLG